MQCVAQQKDTDRHPVTAFKFQNHLPNLFPGRDSFQNALLYIYSKSLAALCCFPAALSRVRVTAVLCIFLSSVKQMELVYAKRMAFQR